MVKAWDDFAWEDYLYWQAQDKKILKRINCLLQDIERNGYSGIGKPEPLKGSLQGYWSHRINDTRRLVYRITGNRIEILQRRSHYGCKQADMSIPDTPEEWLDEFNTLSAGPAICTQGTLMRFNKKFTQNIMTAC